MGKPEILDAYQVYYQCRLTDVQKKSKQFRATTPQDCFRRRNAPLQALRPCSSEGALRPATSFLRDLPASEGLQTAVSSGSLGSSEALTSWAPLAPRAASRQSTKAWANGGASSSVRSFQPTPARLRRDSLEKPAASEQEFSVADEPENEAPTEEEERALALLQRSTFFKNLEPEVLAELPRMASFMEAPKGAVVFRQGDPPANCWLIVRGEVGFYISQSVPDSARLPVTHGYEHVVVAMPWEETIRVRTLDGTSTTSMETNLGKCVNKARSGAVFGELALMKKDATRKASAKCHTNCEFLLLPASAFTKAKDRLLQLQEMKKRFLNKFVPEMKGFPEPGPFDPPHPSFYFNKLKVDEEYFFLKQGERDSRVIYVIHKGNVHLRREKETGSEVCQKLLPGQLFGSWFQHTVEPLSAVAATACEVWFVKASDLRLLPSKLLTAVQEHLSEEYANLLKAVHVSRRFGWETQMPKLEHRPKPLPRHVDPERWAEQILHEVHDQEMRTQFFAATIGQNLINRQWRP
mmetsp:Transcript_50059/g.116831  ORF Transcript_50059/g.116831 Transcript_50059/m.116831 type:complete len:522 (-) Transcript_50059:107-1672(-)